MVGLSERDRHALRSLFSLYDKDLSGYIDQTELLPLLKALGVLSPAAAEGDGEADALLAEMEMADMDTDGDELISFEELCDYWARSGRGPPPARPDVTAAKALTRHLQAQFLSE